MRKISNDFGIMEELSKLMASSARRPYDRVYRAIRDIEADPLKLAAVHALVPIGMPQP